MRRPLALALALTVCASGCTLLGLFDAPADMACALDADCAGLATGEPCLRAFCDVGACRFRYRDSDGDGEGDVRCVGIEAQGRAADCDDADPITSSMAIEACDGRDQDCDDAIDEECIGADAITCGAQVSCAIRRGEVLCWGDHSSGELGALGARADGTGRPAPIRGLPGDVTALTIGQEHACALDARGGVWCWGSARDGRLGSRVEAAFSVTPLIVEIPPAKAVCAGQAHTCALTLDGEMYCWGHNDRGEVAAGGAADFHDPVASRAGPFERLACGTELTCASRDTRVECWGKLLAGWGELQSFELGSAARALDVGDGTVCAIDANGHVACLGEGSAGQIGDGARIAQLSFITLPMPIGARSVSVGLRHVCASDESAQAWCWGAAIAGETGPGELLEDVLEPRLVSALGPIAAISAGEEHTCALTLARTVECFGAGGRGEAGAPPAIAVLEPRAVGGI